MPALRGLTCRTTSQKDHRTVHVWKDATDHGCQLHTISQIGYRAAIKRDAPNDSSNPRNSMAATNVGSSRMRPWSARYCIRSCSTRSWYTNGLTGKEASVRHTICDAVMKTALSSMELVKAICGTTFSNTLYELVVSHRGACVSTKTRKR